MLVSKLLGRHGAPVERSAFFEAIRLTSGTWPGIFAWGMVTGMAMVKSGMSLAHALEITVIVFAGSAQLAVLPLIAADAPLLVIFFTALVVNLRFVIFSAIVGPHFNHLPWYKRLWYGYFNSDMAVVFFPRRFGAASLHDPAGKIGFFSGIFMPNWLAWQVGSLVGILLAGQIPDSWGIGFAGTLALLAIMVPLTVNVAALGGVIMAGTVAVLARDLPYRLGLLAAVMLGMAVAMAIDTALDDNQAGDVE